VCFAYRNESTKVLPRANNNLGLPSDIGYNLAPFNRLILREEFAKDRSRLTGFRASLKDILAHVSGRRRNDQNADARGGISR
jgi:hypothetical protein